MLWSLSVKMVFNDSYIGFVPMYAHLMGKMQCLQDAKAAHAPWYQAAAGVTPGMATQLQVSCYSWLGCTQQAGTVPSDHSPEW